eukprot:TRINITY_DN47702_c0_g1_i1.p1 TRINITY_DN47702_c0_g1~~TRINITY_DN47702_c0_g1_i1.p1  ORF type:complete len:408 (-),score=76.68 TRINITY_DN47702_c0_g1_i1:7-1191(-)
MAPKKKSAATAAPKAAPPAPQEGKLVASPIGLPPGWRAVEKEYKSGQYAGKTYIRYETDKHKSVGSVKKAIELYAKDNGMDVDQMFEEYKEMQKKEAEEKNAREGKVSKEKREEYIALFRAKHGQLSGALVTSLPGWRGESKLLENCGQLCATYYDPQGRVFKLMKDIEAYFGSLMAQGSTDLPDFAAAQAGVRLDEKGKPINAARQENIVEEFTQEKKSTKRKREYFERVVRDEWYREVPQVRVLQGASDVLKKEQIPNADDLSNTEEQLRILMAQRHFDPNTPLLYVLTRVPGMGVAGKKLLDTVQGFYLSLSDTFNGLPVYQQVKLSNVKPGTLVCTDSYLFFSSHRKGWKFSRVIDDSKAGLLMCKDDKPLPTELKQPWEVYEPRAATGE